MTRLAAVAAAAVGAYELYAWKSRRAPTITRIVHITHRHFVACCPFCGEPLRRQRPPYRGWHTSPPK